MARSKNSSTYDVFVAVKISDRVELRGREAKPPVSGLPLLLQQVLVSPKVHSVPQWQPSSELHENGDRSTPSPVRRGMNKSVCCELFPNSIEICLTCFSALGRAYCRRHW